MFSLLLFSILYYTITLHKRIMHNDLTQTHLSLHHDNNKSLFVMNQLHFDMYNDDFLIDRHYVMLIQRDIF
jgi:hypothetical protein